MVLHDSAKVIIISIKIGVLVYMNTKIIYIWISITWPYSIGHLEK